MACPSDKPPDHEESNPKPTSAPRKGMAIASLVLGIVGLATFGLLGIGAIIGTVLGTGAAVRAHVSPAKYGGKNLALGSIGANLVALTLFVSFVLIPDMVPSTVTQNESITMGDVRTILSAQSYYARANGGYFDRLECLSNPHGCIPDYPTDAPVFVDSELTRAPVKSGYRRVFHPGPEAELSEAERSQCSPTSLVSFAFVAIPEEPGESGVRAFCGDSTGRFCEFVEGEVPIVREGSCPQDCREAR